MAGRENTPLSMSTGSFSQLSVDLLVYRYLSTRTTLSRQFYRFYEISLSELIKVLKMKTRRYTREYTHVSSNKISIPSRLLNVSFLFTLFTFRSIFHVKCNRLSRLDAKRTPMIEAVVAHSATLSRLPPPPPVNSNNAARSRSRRKKRFAKSTPHNIRVNACNLGRRSARKTL